MTTATTTRTNTAGSKGLADHGREILASTAGVLIGISAIFLGGSIGMMIAGSALAAITSATLAASSFRAFMLIGNADSRP